MVVLLKSKSISRRLSRRLTKTAQNEGGMVLAREAQQRTRTQQGTERQEGSEENSICHGRNINKDFAWRNNRLPAR